MCVGGGGEMGVIFTLLVFSVSFCVYIYWYTLSQNSIIDAFKNNTVKNNEEEYCLLEYWCLHV